MVKVKVATMGVIAGSLVLTQRMVRPPDIQKTKRENERQERPWGDGETS